MNQDLSKTHPSFYKELETIGISDGRRLILCAVAKHTLDKQVVRDVIADCQKTMNAIHPVNQFQIDVFVVGLIARLGLDKEE